MEPSSRTSLSPEYYSFAEGEISGIAHRRFLPENYDWRKLLEEIDEDPGTILRKGGGQGLTSRRRINGNDLFVKRYYPSRVFRRLRDCVGCLRAAKEWEANLRAAQLGIRTGTVAAAVSVRKGINTRHYLMTFPCEGECISDLLKSYTGEGLERERLLERLACYIATLHEAGFFHAHLNAAHVFEDKALGFQLIDLEASRIKHPLPKRLRRRNMAQIKKSLKKQLSTDEVRLFEKQYRKARKTMVGGSSSDELMVHTLDAAHKESQTTQSS